MDVDALLNIEKRTGVKDSDIDTFLSKVTNVQNTIQGMKDGTISPDDINFKDHGIKSDEEERKEKEEKKKRLEEWKRREAEAAALAKSEELDKWWRHAEGWVGRKRDGSPLWDDEGDSAEVETQDEILKRMEKKVEDAYSSDYSRWNQWEPKDAATLEEKAEQEALLDKVRDAEFEKNNSDWCKQFKDDMEGREKKRIEKDTAAEKAKNRGNQYFKRKMFEKAAVQYMEALELTPFKVPLLTNLVQVYMRQSNLEDAAEFCERALFLDPKCIKAYSRRAGTFTQSPE